MKINLFYIMIGIVAIVGGWFLYHAYLRPVLTPSVALTASAGISSGAIGNTTPDSPATLATATATLSAIAPATSGSIETFIVAVGPTTPTGLTSITSTDAMIVLSWGASYDPSGVAGYRIFMNGKETGTASSQRFEVQNLQASTTYIFAVSAYNQNGKISPLSASVPLSTQPPRIASTATSTRTTSSATSSIDTVPPSAPTNLSAVAISGSEIDLSWSPATDNVSVVGYRIYSNNVFIATSSEASYKSVGLVAGSNYSYTVAAYDAAGNVGPQSASANATTLSSVPIQTSVTNNTTPATDTTPPTTSITSPAAGAIVSGTVTVSTSASDDTGVIKVELYVDSVLQANDTSLPYSFSLNTTPLSNGTHALSTKAYDAAGNIGTSAAVSITVNNAATTNTTTTNSTTTETSSSTPPSAPTHLTAVAISSSEIDLSWTAPVSSTTITGYRIFRDGHPFALLTSPNTTYSNITQLASGTTYAYAVSAYISSPSNTSPQSASASATTP